MHKSIYTEIYIAIAFITLSPAKDATAALVNDTSCVGNVDTDDVTTIMKNADDTKSEKTKKLSDLFSGKAAAISRADDYKKIMSMLSKEAINTSGATDSVIATSTTKIIAAAMAVCTSLQKQDSFTLAKALDEGCKTGGYDCLEAKSFVAGTPTGGDSKYSLYLGGVYSLEAAGSWHSSGEASFVSRTEWFGKTSDPTCKPEALESPWRITCGWVSSFEATYSSLGKLEGDSTQTFNPFTSSNGIFRTNIGVEWAGKTRPWYGLTGGVGFTTYPRSATDTNKDVDARTRIFFGLSFHADYGKTEDGNADGHVFLGYAKDQFWKWQDGTGQPHNESNRYVLDAIIDSPGIFNSKSARLSLRLFSDLPTSNQGPSDVRISLLLNIDLGTFFK